MSVRDEARTLAGLALPVVLGQLGFVLMGVTDTIVIGQVSRDALASVSLGHLFSFAVLVFGYGALRGLDPHISQAYGAGDREATSLMLGRVLALGAALAIPSTLLHLVSTPILSALGQPVAILPTTQSYCLALIPGVLPALLFAAMAQYLQGLGQMRAPTVVIVGANVLNVGLDVALVYGVEALGIPAMGAFGCGVATTLVRWASVLGLGLVAWRTWRTRWPKDWGPVWTRASWRGVLSDAVPVGFQSGLEAWAFSAMGLMMGALGELVLAAHAVALSVTSTLFMIPFGISAAAATRVGHLVGAREPWKTTAWLAVAFATGAMALASVLLLVLGRPIAGLYTKDPEVIALVLTLFPVAAGFQLFDGAQVAAFGVLRGAGDTRVPSIANVVGYWCLGLPLGYVFGVVLGQDPAMIWGGIALALAIVSMLLLARMRAMIRRGARRVKT